MEELVCGMNCNFPNRAESAFLNLIGPLVVLYEWKNTIVIEFVVLDIVTLLEKRGNHTPLVPREIFDPFLLPTCHTFYRLTQVEFATELEPPCSSIVVPNKR